MAQVESPIEIRDPEINVEEIMTRIRQRIQERRAQANAQGLDYDKLVEDRGASRLDGNLSADLYYDLHQLRTNAEGILVPLAMRDRHIPVFNFIFFRLEKLLHRLVLKYVNMLGGRQVVFNRTTTQVLTELVRAFDDDQRRIAELEQQVLELRKLAVPVTNPGGD